MNEENLFSFSNFKRLFIAISYAFLFFLVLLCIYTFFVVDVMKKDYVNIFGYTYFSISTNNKSEKINDIVFIKIKDEVEIGDVITFKNNEGDIVSQNVIEKSSDKYIVEGNDLVLKNDVIGKVQFVVSPGFIIKLIILFLILFIFLSLINFDKLFKKYLLFNVQKSESIKSSEVPDEIFKSNLKRVDDSLSTGETIWVPVDEIQNIKIDKEKNMSDVEVLDDDLGYENSTLETALIDEVVNLLKMRNDLFKTSRITKKWINKFHYVYTLALYYSNGNIGQFKNTINNVTFEEVFDYDLEKIGFYEKLRSRIFDMPVSVYIRLMIYAVMYNDVEYFDAIYKILKYKIHLDVKNDFINNKDSENNIEILINFMKDFVNNFDNKNSFDLEKIEKLVKVNSYEVI